MPEMTAGAIAEASQNRETTVAEEDSSKRKRLLDENDGAENVVQTKRPRDDPGSEHLAGGSGEGKLSKIMDEKVCVMFATFSSSAGAAIDPVPVRPIFVTQSRRLKMRMLVCAPSI